MSKHDDDCKVDDKKGKGLRGSDGQTYDRKYDDDRKVDDRFAKLEDRVDNLEDQVEGLNGDGDNSGDGDEQNKKVDDRLGQSDAAAGAGSSIPYDAAHGTIPPVADQGGGDFGAMPIKQKPSMGKF